MNVSGLVRVLGAGLAVCCASAAHAVTLSLVYTGDNQVTGGGNVVAAVGDVLTFDVVVDTQDIIIVGGAFDIFFDDENLAYAGATGTDLGDDDFYTLPDLLPESGLLWFWGFGSFDGVSGVQTVGSVAFELTGVAGSANPLIIATQNTPGIASMWIDWDDLVTPVDVDFGSVTIIPLPAAFWLLLSGLGVFARLRAS